MDQVTARKPSALYSVYESLLPISWKPVHIAMASRGAHNAGLIALDVHLAIPLILQLVKNRPSIRKDCISLVATMPLTSPVPISSPFRASRQAQYVSSHSDATCVVAPQFICRSSILIEPPGRSYLFYASRCDASSSRADMAFLASGPDQPAAYSAKRRLPNSGRPRNNSSHGPFR